LLKALFLQVLSYQKARFHPKGVIVATYVGTGEVRTGPFAMDSSTESTLARSKKLAYEG
jgi:hypothetical protein